MSHQELTYEESFELFAYHDCRSMTRTMRVLLRAKALMDAGMTVKDAFGLARDEIEQRYGQRHD